MPLDPAILDIIPFDISVVAFPNIFGPTIENIVLAKANKNTTNNLNLYCDK